MDGLLKFLPSIEVASCYIVLKFGKHRPTRLCETVQLHIDINPQILDLHHARPRPYVI